MFDKIKAYLVIFMSTVTSVESKKTDGRSLLFL